MFEKIKSSIQQIKAQLALRFWTAFIAACYRFKVDQRAVGIRNVMMAILGLSIGLYVAASILPTAIINITTASVWTGAPAVVQTLATVVVGIVAIVALIMLILRFAR